MLWYLIHTKPARESLAEQHLERQGYEVYLPRLLERARRERAERIVPLFPRYLFLRLIEGRQALSPARYSSGVSTVVRFGTEYTIVPGRIIQDLRERADPQTGLHRLVARPAPQRGAAVRITEGPFEGLAGVFEREAGRDRVVVLLTLLGQESRVRLPAHCLLPDRAA